MALLTDATVIVEAGESSGTRMQGWEALRLGRPLFLLESLARDPELSWPRQMIDHGAQVLSRQNLEAGLAVIAAKARSAALGEARIGLSDRLAGLASPSAGTDE